MEKMQNNFIHQFCFRSLLFFSADDAFCCCYYRHKRKLTEWMAQGKKHRRLKERNFLFTVIFHHSYRTNFSFENKLEVIILEYWSEDSQLSQLSSSSLSCRYVLEYKVCCYHIDNFLLVSRFIKREEKRWHGRLTGWRRKCFLKSQGGRVRVSLRYHWADISHVKEEIFIR